jgi:hypothetical protein
MAGIFGTAAFLCLASGVRELTRFQYYAPRFAHKIKGYGDWEELRPRHPAPGSEPTTRNGNNDPARSL